MAGRLTLHNGRLKYKCEEHGLIRPTWRKSKAGNVIPYCLYCARLNHKAYRITSAGQRRIRARWQAWYAIPANREKKLAQNREYWKKKSTTIPSVPLDL